MAFITINPLTSELYPTTFRTSAIGFTSGLGRLGATLMPVIVMDTFNINVLGPFLVFALMEVTDGCSNTNDTI